MKICKNCENRYLGCHDHCKEFKAYKQEKEEIKRKYKLDKLKYGKPTYSNMYASV